MILSLKQFTASTERRDEEIGLPELQVATLERLWKA